MKKVLLGMCATLLMSSPALALELPASAATSLPAIFATDVDGSVVYKKLATAYLPSDINDILGAYNAPINPAAVSGIPVSYAKNMDGDVAYGSKAMGYSPTEFNSILNAYNLSLSPEDVVEQDLAALNYAHVADGEVVLHDTVIVYDAMNLDRILAAYQLPEVIVVIVDGDDDMDGVANSVDVCPNTPKGVKADDRGCWVMAHKFLFAFDSAEIKTDYKPILDKAGEIFALNPMLNIQVDGYTDSTGPAAYNQNLSERRAQAVKTYMVEEVGVDSQRLTTVGFGEANPVMSNDTKEGRAKNRRIEFTTVQ